MQGTVKERVLRKPSQDDRVIRLPIARAFGDEPNGNMVARDRPVADGFNGWRLALEVT